DADEVQRIRRGEEDDLAAVVRAAYRAQRVDRLRQRELLADESGDEAAAAHLAARLHAAQHAEHGPPRRRQALAREELADDDAVAPEQAARGVLGGRILGDMGPVRRAEQRPAPDR